MHSHTLILRICQYYLLIFNWHKENGHATIEKIIQSNRSWDRDDSNVNMNKQALVMPYPENGTIDANATPTETTLSIWKNAVLFRPNCDNARSGKRDDGDEYNGSTDRRIYWKLVAENVFIWHRVVGKVQGYHKKRGKWRSYRSDLWVKVEGTVYSKKDCTSTSFDIASDASFPSPVTHSKVREKAVAPFGVPICIMKNDVHGTHLGAGGIVKYSVLTW